MVYCRVGHFNLLLYKSWFRDSVQVELYTRILQYSTCTVHCLHNIQRYFHFPQFSLVVSRNLKYLKLLHKQLLIILIFDNFFKSLKYLCFPFKKLSNQHNQSRNRNQIHFQTHFYISSSSYSSFFSFLCLV